MNAEHDFPHSGPPGGRGRGGFGSGPHGRPPFGPHGGPPRRGRAPRGDVRGAILSLLSELDEHDAQERNGYALIRLISERTDGLWRPSPGSVYPTLQQLVDEGLIDAVEDGRRTAYQLTEEGRAHVRDHAERLERVWRMPERTPESAALHASIRKFFGAVEQLRTVADDAQRAEAVTIIDKARRSIYALLAE